MNPSLRDSPYERPRFLLASPCGRVYTNSPEAGSQVAAGCNQSPPRPRRSLKRTPIPHSRSEASDWYRMGELSLGKIVAVAYPLVAGRTYLPSYQELSSQSYVVPLLAHGTLELGGPARQAFARSCSVCPVNSFHVSVEYFPCRAAAFSRSRNRPSSGYFLHTQSMKFADVR